MVITKHIKAKLKLEFGITETTRREELETIIYNLQATAIASSHVIKKMEKEIIKLKMEKNND